MVLEAAPLHERSRVLDNGCGLGLYVEHLRAYTPLVFGLEYELDRAIEAHARLGPGRPGLPANPDAWGGIVCAAGEALPFAGGSFDLILSNEVIEHVADDRAAVAEMARVLRPGGRIVIFCPNRWYPVEQHGVYWRGTYRFGNIPLVNWLPDPLRDRLAPHVRTYTARRLRRLCAGLPLRVVRHTRIFGGYDNLIRRLGPAGKLIRALLQGAEGTPFDLLGLSHLLVLERLPGQERRSRQL
jgi:SAM-dependent methyltransferase